MLAEGYSTRQLLTAEVGVTHPVLLEARSWHQWFDEFNKVTILDEEPNHQNMDKSSLVNYCRQLRNQLNTTVIREDKPTRSDEHPTMKPVNLIVHMIRNSSARHNTVLDLCVSSGSTLIACKKLRRQSRVMGIDPAYCDVIIRRWQEFTVQQAKHQKGTTFRILRKGE